MNGEQEADEKRAEAAEEQFHYPKFPYTPHPIPERTTLLPTTNYQLLTKEIVNC